MKDENVVNVEIPSNALLYLLKVFKLASWAEKALVEMRTHSAAMDMAEIERVMFTMLALLSATHEGLASCAKVAGFPEWREELNKSRRQDSLLFYMWKARDSDVHNAIIKWALSESLFEMRVIDPAKAVPIMYRANLPNDIWTQCMRIGFHLCGVYSETALISKLQQGFRPNEEQQNAIGVQMRRFLSDVVLLPINVRMDGKSITVPTPSIHLGNYHEFNLDKAFSMALDYYKSKVAELVLLLGASGVPVPQFEAT